MSISPPLSCHVVFTSFPERGLLLANGDWIRGVVCGEAISHWIDVRAMVEEVVTYGRLEFVSDEDRVNQEIRFSIFLKGPPGRFVLRLELFDVGSREWRQFFRGEMTASGGEMHLPNGGSPNFEWSTLELLRQKKALPGSSWRKLGRELKTAIGGKIFQIQPESPFHGSLEEPENTIRVNHGMLSVNGWIAHESQPIKTLIAYVDPHFPSVLHYGGPRSDVEKTFPALWNGGHSHFSGEVFVPAEMPQPWPITICTPTDKGMHCLFSRRLWGPPFNADIPGDLPAYSTWDFLRASLFGLRQNSMRISRQSLFSTRATFREHAPPRVPLANIRYREKTPQLKPAGTRSVVIVNDNFILGGAALFAFEYGKFLKTQLAWSVRLVSPTDGPLRALCTDAGMETDIVDLSSLENNPSAADFERHLAAIAKSSTWQQTDLVIANTLVAYWAVALAIHLRKPSVFYVHESARLASLFSATEAMLAREAIAQATRTVFLTEWTRQHHLRSQRRGNFRLMRSWVKIAEIDAFIAANPKNALRERHGISPDAIVVVCLGSICDRKGQRVLVRAIAHCVKSFHAPMHRLTKFLFVGARPTPDVDQLKRDIKEHALDGIVSIIGETSLPQNFMRMADIYACPSFEEGFPRSLMEAAAFGLHIVTTTVCGIPEMLSDNEAWLVPAGDPRSFAAAMDDAMQAHIKGDSGRANRARERVARLFDAREILPQHVELLAEALSHAA